MNPIRAAGKWLAAALLCFGCAAAVAQSWPSQPVHIIVPYAPGGTIDILARHLGDALTRSLGASFIVENRAGAGGVVGTQFAAIQPADGYTILFSTVSHTLTPSLHKLPFDAEKDFVAVVQVADSPQVLFRNSAFPIHTLHELIAAARENPGTFNYAHGGNGSPANIAAELLKSMMKIDIVAVPYKGAGPVVIDVMAGQVGLGVVSLPAVAPFLRGGKLYALGVSTRRRTKSLPDVPTFAEEGASGYDFNTWFGLLAPKGTPPKIVNRLAEATDKALRSPKLNAVFAEQGADPVGGKPEDFERLLKTEFARWPAALKNAGIVGEK